MALLGDDRTYQDLLGQNSSFISQDIDDLDVLNSLKLEYATPDKNLVVDSNKNVITEDKDSFVDVPNKITWSQVGRQFTANLPQRIDQNCPFVCGNITSTDYMRLDGDLTFRSSGIGNYNHIYFQNTYNHALSYIVPTSSYDDAYFRFKVNGNNSIKIGKTIIEPLQTNITLGKSSAPFDELHTNNIYLNDDIYMKNNKEIHLRDNSHVKITGYADTQLRFTIGNAERIVYGTPHMYPLTTYNMGAATAPFANMYLNGFIDISGTQIGSTTWNYLSTINQNLSTSSNVSFNTITTTGRTLNLNSNGRVRITSTGDNVIRFHTNDTVRWITSDTRLRPNTNNTYDLGGADYNWRNGFIRTLIIRNNNVKIASGDNNSIDFYVTGYTHTVRLQNDTFRPNITTYDLGNNNWKWNSLYLKTAIILNGTTLDSTQFNRLVAINQDLTTASDVQFTDLTATNVSVINRLKLSHNNTTEYGIQFRYPEKNALEFVVSNGVYYRMDTSKLYTIHNASLGDSSNKWHDLYADGNAEFNTSSAGYVSMNELRSVDYQSGSPTNDSLIEMRGQKQYLRFRRGGNPVFTTGIMFSHFDTSNFYINSSGSGNLRITHGTLLNEGDGGGSVNATTVADIKSNGEIRANHFSNERAYRCHLWLDQMFNYEEVISNQATWERFNSLMSETLGTELTNFTFSTSDTSLKYTGEIDRYFLVKYKITATTSNDDTFFTAISRQRGSTYTRFDQSRCRIRLKSVSGTFVGEAFVKLQPNDTIYMILYNLTSSNNIFIESFSLMAYDLNYLAT